MRTRVGQQPFEWIRHSYASRKARHDETEIGRWLYSDRLVSRRVRGRRSSLFYKFSLNDAHLMSQNRMTIREPDPSIWTTKRSFTCPWSKPDRRKAKNTIRRERRTTSPYSAYIGVKVAKIKWMHSDSSIRPCLALPRRN